MSILEVAGFIGKFGGGLNLKSKLKWFFLQKCQVICSHFMHIFFTTLCYAMLFIFDDKLWDLNAML